MTMSSITITLALLGVGIVLTGAARVVRAIIRQIDSRAADERQRTLQAFANGRRSRDVNGTPR